MQIDYTSLFSFGLGRARDPPLKKKVDSLPLNGRAPVM